jgi:hypothetical protein
MSVMDRGCAFTLNLWCSIVQGRGTAPDDANEATYRSVSNFGWASRPVLVIELRQPIVNPNS